MNNKEILENAPEDATHIDSEFRYLKKRVNSTELDCWLKYHGQAWYEHQRIYLSHSIRSIADIERIAELEKENAELKGALTMLRQRKGNRVILMDKIPSGGEL